MNTHMKRTFFIIAAVAALAVSAGAQAPKAQDPSGQSAVASAGASAIQGELGAAMAEMSDDQLGTLTVGDLIHLAGRVSVAEQNARYVERARAASRMLPGVGQFMTGDAVGGSLYFAADIALMTGVLIAAYALLPSNVQFSSLDYFGDPIGTIRSRWESNSSSTYLPAAAVMLGGMIVKAVLGHSAAEDAARRARENVAAGNVTFTPNLEFLGRGVGVGMSMQF
jgi:hypothetical protein